MEAMGLSFDDLDLVVDAFKFVGADGVTDIVDDLLGVAAHPADELGRLRDMAFHGATAPVTDGTGCVLPRLFARILLSTNILHVSLLLPS